MKIVGHRGARGLAPENTLASIEHALEHQVDEVEFDLRVTRDNIAILHHDAELTNMSGAKLNIGGHTYNQLKQHKADLATFEEALKTIGKQAVPHIEVKPGEPTGPIAKTLEREIAKGRQPEEFLLASKDQKVLRALQQSLPDVPKVVIEPWSGVRGHYRARQIGATCLSMNQRWLWWGFIHGFKSSRYRLYAYTLNDPDKAQRWARYGLYGVITDHPDRFRP